MSFSTPVLFLIFNRPDCTARVFETIRNVRPKRLYIASDGSRKQKIADSEKVKLVRDIATQVDWECEVFTLFQEKNLGCKMAVSTVISWFFRHEERGIILEDDCLPNLDFFKFCEMMLEDYKDDQRIWAITGDNFQNGITRGEGSYYFSKYMHVWGWATWRRTWSKYDVEIKFWPNFKRSAEWRRLMNNTKERNYWNKILDKVHKRSINTWDYQLSAIIWKNSGLVITPNINLVKNIGLGIEATHTKTISEGIDAKPLGAIRLTPSTEHDNTADEYLFRNHYNIRKISFSFLFSKIYSLIK